LRHFSFVWGAYDKQENVVDFVHNILSSKTVPEFVEKMEGIGHYNGAPMNLILASRNGDIGYMLLTPHPIRKGNVPHLGSMVQDGTTSEYDWTGEFV